MIYEFVSIDVQKVFDLEISDFKKYLLDYLIRGIFIVWEDCLNAVSSQVELMLMFQV